MFENILKKLSFLCALNLCVFACVASGQNRQRQTTMLVGDVLNFELPNFDDDTGLKEWELFGDKATYVDEARIDIQKMRLRLFEAKAGAPLKAVITSPVASVNPTTKFVKSQSDIFVEADEFNLAGKVWQWDGAKKIVRIFDDVKINFTGGKPDAKDGVSAAKNAAGKDAPEIKTRVFSDYASMNHGSKNNIFELKKNVRVVSDDMKINCDEMLIDSPKKGGVSEISAAGNVKIERDNISASSGSALVDPVKSTALLKISPQIFDSSSKATLTGDSIFLDKQNKTVVSTAAGKTRARTILLHVDKAGKEQTIIISADKIVMKDLGKTHTFDFKGKVNVIAPDFIADCDEMTAVSNSSRGGSKAKVESIKGKGSVKFVNDDGEASSENIEIIPQKSEVWLTENARLKDKSRGTVLKSAVLIFVREKNSGVALSNQNDKNSFVRLEINEDIAAAEIGRASGTATRGKNQFSKSGKAKPKKSNPALVKSKILKFHREGENMFFTFIKDVSISSDSANVTCAKMDVFAKSEKKGTAKVSKIVATDNVHLVQKNYEADAEVATIYPKLDMDKAATHRYVELATAKDNPLKRPTVVLPAFGNLGLDTSLASDTKSAKTVIKSDKQWLMSNPNGVDKYFFEGNVNVSGTDMLADCDKIEVQMKAPKVGAQKEISQIIMRGNIKMRQGLKEVECGRADIYADEQMVVLSQDPVIVNKQDNTRVSAPRIVYNKGESKVIFEQDNRQAESVDLGEDAERPTMVLPPIENVKNSKADENNQKAEKIQSADSPKKTPRYAAPKFRK